MDITHFLPIRVKMFPSIYEPRIQWLNFQKNVRVIILGGEFAISPQVLYLRVVRDEWNGLLGYPVQNNSRACQVIL